MSNIPQDLRYAPSHEWLRVNGDIGTMGITDHAQNELTDIVYVELPKVGTVTAARGTIAVVESVKAASDIYSPASGEVIEVNRDLESQPALLNQDPYGRGWICKLKLSNTAEIEQLKSPADYVSQLGS